MGSQQSLPADELPGGAKHQTHLQYRNTWRVDSANRLFGACYDGNTVVIINPGRSPVKPYIRVPEGTYALVQNQGRDIDWHGPSGARSAVWPPGFHWASPFTKVAHLVTKQYIVFDTPVKGCKTADDVTVSIDMCLVLRIMGDEKKGEDPELVRRFVYELGPNGLEVQLRAAQDEAVRALARSVLHTEVYQLRDGTMKERFNTGALNYRTNVNELSATDELTTPKSFEDAKGSNDDTPIMPEAKVLYCVTEDIKRNLNAQFNTYGVEITSVAITDVKLPDTFQEQMQSRTTHLSAIKEQNMKQMSDMQLLQYKEEIDMTKLKRRMMIMEEEQTGKAQCAEIQKEVDLINADVKLVQEQIAQETRVRVNNLSVEANLKIAQIRADTERIAKEISAHCDADIDMIRAETDALALQLKALVEELRVSGDAKAAEIVARAEGVAAKKLEKFRAHELSMKRLDMLASLAKNKQTVVSGDTSGSLLADMLVANRQQGVLLNVDAKKDGTAASFSLVKS
jgi:regulator of protease activity HflC (stomatin/prohibitin superfamily)